MKNILLLFAFITITALANASENELTDEQAIEMGMTLVDESQVSTTKNRNNNSSFSFDLKDEHLDLAKHVVVINKGLRSESNKSGQTVRVFQDGAFLYEFDTSTGTEKAKRTTSGRTYIATTPVGIFRPKRAFKEYQSRTFRGANMDYAVFFNGGIALHSTSKAAYSKLGQRASGGCARLRYEDAMTLNELIRTTGEGHDKMWDVGIEGLTRFQYYDRVKMNDLNRYNGSSLSNLLWTYDTAIVVVDRD